MSEVVDTTHAPFAPSNFKRKSLCAGSHAAEKQYPDKSNDAAIDGTHTHTLVETCLIHNKSTAQEYLGKSLADHEGEFEIKQDRIDRANVALNYVDNQVKHSAFPVLVSSERRVNPGNLIFRDDWYGTGDITMVCVEENIPNTLIIPTNIKWITVADYKDGAQPVEPFENYQGISYMLGVIAELNPPFDTPIRFTIIQPKSGGVKEWDTTVDELMTVWLPKCEKIIMDSLDPTALRTPGDEQCGYCLHKLDCEERQAAAVGGINTAMAAVDFTSTEPVTPVLPAKLPVISEMTNETISQVKMVAGIIRGWLKDIDAEALDRVMNGQKVPLHKMIQKNGRRSWQPEQQKIMKALLALTSNKERIFKKADIVEEQLISFTKVLGNSNLSAAQKKRIEKDFIKHPNGQKVLVLETEKGVDISPAALLENEDMPVVLMNTGNEPQ